MYETDGVGLAAPQVGVKRIIVVDDHAGSGSLHTNPEITHAEGSRGPEGCLCTRYFGDVERFDKITVKGIDPHNKKVKLKLKDLARIFQHD
ncbi:MAG: peptide deformylase [Veillonella sp.]